MAKEIILRMEDETNYELSASIQNGKLILHIISKDYKNCAVFAATKKQWEDIKSIIDSKFNEEA